MFISWSRMDRFFSIHMTKLSFEGGRLGSWKGEGAYRGGWDLCRWETGEVTRVTDIGWWDEGRSEGGVGELEVVGRREVRGRWEEVKGEGGRW